MRHSDAARSPYRDDFQYHLLADPRTINAFALPGGQVFITRGLYDHLTTEAQLAAVLGHETGHVIERHAAQQMAKGQLGQLLVTAAGIGASSSNHPGRGYGAAAVAGVIDKMKQLSFSRHDETQADECGLTYMTEAGFDPRAMLKVMEILQQVTAATGRQPEMFQTHPYPQHRMEDISAWIKSHYPGGVPSNLTQGGALPR
jgi:predicted Zn-dependent protease